MKVRRTSRYRCSSDKASISHKEPLFEELLKRKKEFLKLKSPAAVQKWCKKHGYDTKKVIDLYWMLKSEQGIFPQD